MKKANLYLLATILAAFGFVTLFLSSSIIFDLFGIRAKEGNYVLIVVWANFISSLAYLFAAYGFVVKRNWTSKLLGVSSVILIAAFIGFFIHINAGGLHETKTIGAMIFRITLTVVFGLFAYLLINKPIQMSNKKADKLK